VAVSLLTVGRYFGQDWYDESSLEYARAKGSVRTVSILTHQAAALRRLFGASERSPDAPPGATVDRAKRSQFSAGNGTA
jgi:hypothetical protein